MQKEGWLAAKEVQHLLASNSKLCGREGGKAGRPLPAGFLARRHHLGMGLIGPSSASVTDPMSWRDCLLMEYFVPVDSSGEQCLKIGNQSRFPNSVVC